MGLCRELPSIRTGMGQYGNDTARRKLAGRGKESQNGIKSGREELATHRFSKTSLIGNGEGSEAGIVHLAEGNSSEEMGGGKAVSERIWGTWTKHPGRIKSPEIQESREKEKGGGR